MIARFRWAPAPRHRFRWIAQQGSTPAMARPGPPPVIAAIIGPTGPAGAEASDPGDLTYLLYLAASE